MEFASPKWLSEFGLMEDPAFGYQEMNPSDDCYLMDELTFQAVSNINSMNHDQNFNSQTTNKVSSGSASTETTQTSSGQIRPAKQQKTNNSWSSYFADHQIINPNSSPSSSSVVLSFENSNSYPASWKKRKVEMGSESNVNYQSLTSQDSFETRHTNTWPISSNKRATTGAMSRSPADAFDHVLAERKRREKLSQRFIALSAVVPGLKKTDKASILGEAVRYLKQLQEQVKTLQEEAAKKPVESIVFVKKSLIYVEDNDSSSTDENSNGSYYKLRLPEIEARVSDKEVLIRIYCENNKGYLVKIISEIEKLGLFVVNSSVLPFGNSTLDVTIIAQMEVNFCLAMKDLVRKLREALLKFPRD